MKNLKRALSLVLSAAMMVGMMVVGTGATFTDVAESDHEAAIEVMSMVGIMKGVSETEFAPEADVTRDQMAVIMCNLLDLKLNGTHPFTDVADWADDYVAAIYVNGYTAGKTATTYGGSDKITTAEAALMIMKTLGYFEYQGEFGDDWLLATVKKATELQLFKDIDAGVKETLNRGEVAQMVLNALDETIRVTTEEGGLSVEGNGISVAVKPTYYHTQVKCDVKAHGGHYIDLGEKLFGETLKDSRTTDAFGRPATKWTYTGNAKVESVLVADEATLVYTAKQSDEKAINKALKDYIVDDNTTVYTNGIATAATSTVAKADIWKLAKNGVLVEMFVDEDQKLTQIVVIEENLGKISSVVKADEDAGTKRAVKIGTKSFETEDFAKKDMVIYTMADGVIKSMKLAETVEGKVNAKTGTYVKIDGVTYKFNAKYDGSKTELTAPKAGDDVKIYVDSYGYLLENDTVTKSPASVSDYVVVIETQVANGWNGNQAKVMYTDGTTAIIDVQTPDVAEGDKFLAFGSVQAGEMYTIDDANGNAKYEFYDVVDDPDVNNKVAGYDALTKTGSYDKDDATINGWGIEDDAVVFVQKNAAKKEYAVLTGAELKGADSLTVKYAYANKAATGFYGIELAYVASDLGSTSDFLYGYITEDLESVLNADDKEVWNITLWNGTETISLLTPSSNDFGLAKGDFVQYKVNEDNELTLAIDAKITTTDYAVTAFDGKTIVLKDMDTGVSESYEITDDTIFAYVDVENKDAVESGDIELAEKEELPDGSEGNLLENVWAAVKVDGTKKTAIAIFADVNNKI